MAEWAMAAPLHRNGFGLRSRRRLLGAALGAMSLRVARAAHELATPLPRARPARIALVLGGGGCRGHAHIGVIRALERSGLKPDLVLGSSAGSLVGALYAAGKTSEELERYGRGVSANLLREWVFPNLGFFGGGAIKRFVDGHAGARSIESLPLRFAAVATDLKTGGLVVLDNGDLGSAVQASASVPGLLEPVRIAGRMLVDGNLSAPLPVIEARRLGARRVVAVDVMASPDEADLADPLDALYQAFAILTRRLAAEESSVADLVITPKSLRHGEMSAVTVKALVDAGEQASRDAMPALRGMFERAAREAP